MRTDIVTGASGFIGSRLVQRLRRDRRSARAASRRDIGDAAFWRRVLPGARAVYHLAAQTSAEVAAADPAADFKSNVLPMLRLLEACRALRRKPAIVFASTVTIAGVPSRLPVDESAPDAPLTVYDTHKLMAEQYLKLYARLGVARGLSLRLPNVYGPGPLSAQPGRGALNAMIAGAAAGEAVTVFGRGRALRDYLYVDDAVDALLAAARAKALDGEHFVLGTGRGCSIAESARLIARRAGVAVRTARPLALGPLGARDFVADPGRFQAAAGWKAEISLEEGIARTLLAGRSPAGPA